MFVLSLLFGFSFVTHLRAISIESEIDEARSNTTLLNDYIITGWVDPPAFRSTANILWSCTLTIVACIYTCIHVNIPPPGTSLLKKILEKVTWASVALILPEVVLQAACGQFADALLLKRHFNKLLKEYNSSHQPIAAARELTLEDAFYIVMGGLTVRLDRLGYPERSLMLTPTGVEFLAAKGHFITVLKAEVEDRSKASPFTKALVCFQVSYMVIQCAARVYDGYHLALLEVNTLVHVFCALCIYLLWWKKPLDAVISIDVDTSKFEDMLALMVMSRSMDSKPSELSCLSLYKPSELIDNRQAGTGSGQTMHAVRNLNSSARSPALAKVNDEGFVKLTPGTYLSNGLQWKKLNKEAIELDPVGIKRWSLCAEALRKGRYGNDSLETVRIETKQCLLPVISPYRWLYDWKFNFFHDEIEGSWRDFFIPGVAISCLPIIYGGVHFSVRNSQFPSEAERLLWIIACISTMVGLPGALISLVVTAFGGHILDEDSRKKYKGRVARLAYRIPALIWYVPFIIAALVCVACLCLYLLSRIYIIVEAFISLRKMPLSVFATTIWLGNIAHVG